jgi:hypothetical protein
VADIDAAGIDATTMRATRGGLAGDRFQDLYRSVGVPAGIRVVDAALPGPRKT